MQIRDKHALFASIAGTAGIRVRVGIQCVPEMVGEAWGAREGIVEGEACRGEEVASSPLTAADPPSRDSFDRGVTPIERGVAEVRGDLSWLRGRVEIRAFIRPAMSREARAVALLDIDPIRRYDLELVDDFQSRMAH